MKVFCVSLLFIGAFLALALGEARHHEDDDCICPFNYDPFCGTDGHTYGNECKLWCGKQKDPYLQVKHRGECGPIATLFSSDPGALSCHCTNQYDPVCGTDYNTYGNACELNCAKRHNPDLDEEHEGECGPIAELM